MTLVLQHDLDMVKMYCHTKNEVSTSTASKVIAQTDRHTHSRWTEREREAHTHTHTMKTREVIMLCKCTTSVQCVAAFHAQSPDST